MKHDALRDSPSEAPSAPRFITVALIVPTLLLAVVVLLHGEFQRSSALLEDASRSFARRLDQIVLLSRLKDAETAQRGYLITGDRAFLQPYEPARRAVRRQLAAAIATHDPEVAPGYLETVETLALAKFAEIDRTIAARRSGRADLASRTVSNGRGRRIMDRLRETIGAMIVYEDERSRARQAAIIADRERVETIVLGVVCTLILVLFALLIIFWRLRVQRHALAVAAFESAERHATILDSTIDAILILNPSGTIETMNAAAARMLGYELADMERRDIATIVDIAPGEGSFHHRIGLIDGRLRQSFVTDRAIRRRDARDIPVDIAMGVMNLPSGQHIVVSLRDISERKRIERVKDDILSTVTHELRSPLTSIVGSLGLLRAGAVGSLSTEAARLVEIAENNSRRLIRLINDLLDMDRIESGKLEMIFAPIDLRTLIDQACLGSEGLARIAGVALHCERNGRAAMVSGDAERLLQVVTNLLSNAIRISSPRARVELGLTIDAGQAIIYVDDDGPGVPPAFRDRIFGRFERADQHDAASGTGLGLAISREIVARHDGAIWFEDRPGGGTRFAFRLALLGGQESEAVPGGQESPPWPNIVDEIGKPGDPGYVSIALKTAFARTNMRLPVILHLDDDPDLLEVVAAAIDPEARIVAAKSVASAREILQRLSPDIAILDMNLADGSATDLMPFLFNASGRAIPTIIYSAQDVPASLVGQVDAVLVKARSTLPELKATVRRIVRQRGEAA